VSDVFDVLEQSCGTCDPREHLLWFASKLLLPKLEHTIASKRSSMISRYFDDAHSMRFPVLESIESAINSVPPKKSYQCDDRVCMDHEPEIHHYYYY